MDINYNVSSIIDLYLLVLLETYTVRININIDMLAIYPVIWIYLKNKMHFFFFIFNIL